MLPLCTPVAPPQTTNTCFHQNSCNLHKVLLLFHKGSYPCLLLFYHLLACHLSLVLVCTCCLSLVLVTCILIPHFLFYYHHQISQPPCFPFPECLYLSLKLCNYGPENARNKIRVQRSLNIHLDRVDFFFTVVKNIAHLERVTRPNISRVYKSKSQMSE